MAEVNSNFTATQVQDPDVYRTAFEQGEPVRISEQSDIRGRILRAREAEEFNHLGLRGRELVFIMGPDALSELPGWSLPVALGRIGLMPDYVAGRIAQGYTFKLAVFRDRSEAPLATWDNALDLIAGCHPALAPDIEIQRQALKDTPPQEFVDRMLPEDLTRIELAGPLHPEFMTTERYLALPTEIRHRDSLYLRRWLVHTEQIGITFRGDGYTQTTDGEKGVKEYLMPNGPIADLQEAVVIDLPLDGRAQAEYLLPA
jgi:hypothetical protein